MNYALILVGDSYFFSSICSLIDLSTPHGGYKHHLHSSQPKGATSSSSVWTGSPHQATCGGEGTNKYWYDFEVDLIVPQYLPWTVKITQRTGKLWCKPMKKPTTLAFPPVNKNRVPVHGQQDKDSMHRSERPSASSTSPLSTLCILAPGTLKWPDGEALSPALL